MKKIVITLSVSFLVVLGCNVPHATKTKDPFAFVTLLGNPDKEIRATAAASIRRLIAVDPSLKTNDHGEEYWKKRIDAVKSGMKHSDVMRLLPPYDNTLSAEQLLWSGMGSGDSHFATWRLDHYWTIRITYRNPDTVIGRPSLQNEAMHIRVMPPEDFTGTWVMWYVNGQERYRIEHTNGKYHGLLIVFYDNGRKSYQQHYKNGLASGSGAGWHPDGSKMYKINYTNGKPTGTWTHWDRDGKVRNVEQKN
ncbi:toxin-antitoxin system YwqK family antitoxin [Verrucomicrobiota bacterium]